MRRLYDLHGLARLEVLGTSAEAEVVDHWLGEFAVDPASADSSDIVWHASSDNSPGHSAARVSRTARDETGDAFVCRHSGGELECWGSGHHLYSLLQDVLLRRGASLVHGCSLVCKGSGMLLFARGGVGKSSVAFGAYARAGVRLLGDDVTIVTAEGELLAFPTPFAIYPYHFAILPPEVRERLGGRRRSQRIAGVVDRIPFGHQLGRRMRQRLIAGGSRRARSIRPGYVSIPARDLFPPDRRAWQAGADIVLYLVPGADDWAVEDLSLDEAETALLAVTYNELLLDESLNLYALASAVDLGGHRRRAGETARAFLGSGAERLRLRIPGGASPQAVQDFVYSEIDRRLPVLEEPDASPATVHSRPV